MNNSKLGGLVILVLLRAALSSKNEQQLRNSCLDVLLDMSGKCYNDKNLYKQNLFRVFPIP